ncbi:MAG: GTPase HflX [Cytophagales bacterium]|jgi:GTP-binding protein HflX|nr:GTPase HflX [Flavobacteriaceae bacterium]|tara:strand:+ start:237 stop:1379 length:1143 start_codon:yes stop_codon:yes gene_type:complete
MGDYYQTKKKTELGVLIAVVEKQTPDKLVKEHLDELAFLAKTLDIKIRQTFVQKIERPDKRTYVGSGKLEEIQSFIKMEKIDLIIFDDELSPSQLRNIENEVKIKVYDRSLLILDIFLRRAQTAQAKIQVELARFQYLLPRLTRMWTHLERQRGGRGTRGGAGEKEIETDKRMVRDRITLLKKQLTKVELQASTRRKSRTGIVRIALVGYTNTGKSSLMNLLGKESVYAKDELFATVDSTVRKVVINNLPFLLSDTVGFIRKLPHDLIASFRSTLAEVREADLLLHIIDVSSPAYEDHIKVVEQTLVELGGNQIKRINVYNKIDQLTEDTPHPENDTKQKSIVISAKTKQNLPALKNLIFEEALIEHLKIYPNYIQPQSF